jgi:threonyl-tRNA synthetase
MAEQIMSEVLADIEAQSGGKIKTASMRARARSMVRSSSTLLRDAIGRDWQCGTTQVDFNAARTFRRVLYRQGLGEEAAGDGAPRDLWLAGAVSRYPDRELCRPFAVVVRAAAGGRGDHHVRGRRVCGKVAKALAQGGASGRDGLRNEKINYKVREHSLAKVPVILVRAASARRRRTVNVRRLLGSRDQSSMTLSAG